MRVYVPATLSLLETLVEAGRVGVPPVVAFAVTPGLREWYVDEDLEALEYAAMLEAARASLRLLDADPATARRRVVIAADVAESAVRVRDDLDRGVVHLTDPVAITEVAAVHVDDADAVSVVSRAADAMIAADLGHAEAQDAVDDAEGFELSWYASQELGALLEPG
jgi:hypothetical protein